MMIPNARLFPMNAALASAMVASRSCDVNALHENYFCFGRRNQAF